MKHHYQKSISVMVHALHIILECGIEYTEMIYVDSIQFCLKKDHWAFGRSKLYKSISQREVFFVTKGRYLNCMVTLIHQYSLVQGDFSHFRKWIWVKSLFKGYKPCRWRVMVVCSCTSICQKLCSWSYFMQYQVNGSVNINKGSSISKPDMFLSFGR